MAESYAKRGERLSKELINTKYHPSAYDAMRKRGDEARAYHELNPYPFFHFLDWKTEDWGPYPRCLPLCRRIVKKGARWLFGKGFAIDVQDSEPRQAKLREIWQQNMMPQRMVKAAELGGVCGQVTIGWSYDETAPMRVRLTVYPDPELVSLYFDPQDRTRLLMGRIQYRFWNESDGSFYWHREEWTDTLHILYRPRKTQDQPNIATPYERIPDPSTDDWQIDRTKVNPFGIVPLHRIRNTETETEWGEGDLWWLFRCIDRINLTFHLMDRSNQFDSEPNKVYIDAMIPPEESNKKMAPGEIEAIETRQEATSQAKVELLQPSGEMRPHMMDYAKQIQREIVSCAGSVDFDPEEITNKGNLTMGVLMQLYEPLIELTNEKRKLYGEDGLCKFFERLSCGLAELNESSNGKLEPEFAGCSLDKPESCNVEIRWPHYFEPTPVEAGEMIDNNLKMVEGRLISEERAIERTAQMLDIEDTEVMMAEIEKDKAEAKAEEEAATADPEDQPE